jgi:hypothetical protein
MAEVAELLHESWGHVSTGALPPPNLIKALISKVCLHVQTHAQPLLSGLLLTALIPSVAVAGLWHSYFLHPGQVASGRIPGSILFHLNLWHAFVCQRQKLGCRRASHGKHG